MTTTIEAKASMYAAAIDRMCVIHERVKQTRPNSRLVGAAPEMLKRAKAVLRKAEKAGCDASDLRNALARAANA